MTGDDSSAVAQTLKDRYNMRIASLARLHHGQGTRNWVAETESARYFVKEYHRPCDHIGEELALRLNQLVGAEGVPVARTLADLSGAHLCVSGAAVLAVSEFAEGATHRKALTLAQMEQAGAVLGRIHRLCQALGPGLEPETPRWLRLDVRKKDEELASLERLIRSRPERTRFDETALELISRRRSQLQHLPSILAVAASLDSQVLHGDYSAMNLLFDDASLRAVIDFQPPHPFLAAYEAGRIAFHPESMMRAGWRERGLALLRAYAAAFPTRRDNLVWCADVWLGQLLRSNYGLKQHYLAPAERQDELDDFFIMRAHAATMLLSERDTLRAALEDLSDELGLASSAPS